MKTEVQFNLEALEKLPITLQNKYFDKALSAAGKPITSRAKQLAPVGNDADRDKRSAKQKAAADWNTRLQTTITQKVVKQALGGMVIVGPKWPKGNKAHFDWGIRSFGKGRPQVFWGRPSGTVKRHARHWLKQAGDEGKKEAVAEFAKVIDTAIGELNG